MAGSDTLATVERYLRGSVPPLPQADPESKGKTMTPADFDIEAFRQRDRKAALAAMIQAQPVMLAYIADIASGRKSTAAKIWASEYRVEIKAGRTQYRDIADFIRCVYNLTDADADADAFRSRDNAYRYLADRGDEIIGRRRKKIAKRTPMQMLRQAVSTHLPAALSDTTNHADIRTLIETMTADYNRAVTDAGKKAERKKAQQQQQQTAAEPTAAAA